MATGKGSGYGKVILFGEHFVVHGISGIVSAIGSTADAQVTKTEANSGITITDQRQGSRGYAQDKKAQQLESIQRIIQAMSLKAPLSMNIRLSGNLPSFSGLGASAASSVAIVRAIAQEYAKNLTDERVNEIAYEAEKAYAGNPSGIDNTAATFGGLMLFKKNLTGGSDNIEKLAIKKPVEIVIGSTGVVANTKAMVEGVAKRKNENPKKYTEIFEQAEALTKAGKKALIDYDLKQVGTLMDENHRLLQQIEVSCKELDYLVNLAREKDALGAKLTGGGGGGCMFALTPTKILQESVAKAIENAGFQVLRTKIGI